MNTQNHLASKVGKRRVTKFLESEDDESADDDTAVIAEQEILQPQSTNTEPNQMNVENVLNVTEEAKPSEIEESGMNSQRPPAIETTTNMNLRQTSPSIAVVRQFTIKLDRSIVSDYLAANENAVPSASSQPIDKSNRNERGASEQEKDTCKATEKSQDAEAVAQLRTISTSSDDSENVDGNKYMSEYGEIEIHDDRDGGKMPEKLFGN